MIIQSAIFVFLLGLIFGSFATALSYRIPLNEDFIKTRSKCIHCDHILGFFQLFPLFSFIWQKGKCKFCQKKISYSYPVIETLCGFIFLIIFFKNGLNIQSLSIYLTFFTLFVASLIDIKTYEVPIKIQLILLSLACIFAIQNSLSYKEFLINPFIIYSCGLVLKYSFYFVRNKDGLGLADINLAFIITIFLGIENFVYFMFLAGTFGVIFGLIWQKIFKQDLFPFFPSLSIAFLISYGIL